MSNPNPPNPEQQIQQAIDAAARPAQGAMPLEVTLATGQVYKGATPQDLLNKVVAAQEEATRTIATERAQREQIHQRMAELEKQIPAPPPDASEAEKQSYYQKWAQNPDEALQQQFAKMLNIPADKVSEVMKKVVESTLVNSAADEFSSRYPGFQVTGQTAAMINDRLKQRFGQTVDATTADNIELVFNELVRTGRVQPPTMQASSVNQPFTPVANLRGQQAPPNPVNSILQDFASLPLDKMKETLERLAANGMK